ncbi:MAG: aspartate-semialdehyde dehydrogenase [Candidatus Oxydemutatoraceae bacterium WSBS_2016_MAG_OTU14]
MSQTKINLAIVGATGAVGETMLKELEKTDFPLGELHLLASSQSAGKQILFGKDAYTVEDLDGFDFSKANIAFFSAGGSVSKQYVPRAVECKCIVIDNTSEFRYVDEIPLIVPEVNGGKIAEYTKTGIIANPNCSTIQMVVALKPLHDRYTLKRINVATYQAVSGTGKEAIEELVIQSRQILDGKAISAQVYPKQIAFNALPHIDEFMPNDYTREEMKMVWETHKIMNDKTIQVNPTAVRIPVLHGHSEAIHAEFAEPPSAEEARTILRNAPGIVVLDEPVAGGYPTAVTEAEGSNQVYVGRIRKDISHACGLDLWVVSDNLRKGAASNSLQIASILARDYL